MKAPPLEQLARAAHDVGLAALLGGNLFGRLAMHPALASVSDKAERGSVLNRAWRRYGTVNSLSLAAVLAGSALARANGESSPPRDAAVAAVAITGVASAIEGVRFAGTAPGGAVPLASGSEAAPETPPKAARLKRALGVLGALNLASDVALVAIDATQRARGPRRSLLPFR